jgi:hypothetical protein
LSIAYYGNASADKHDLPAVAVPDAVEVGARLCQAAKIVDRPVKQPRGARLVYCQVHAPDQCTVVARERHYMSARVRDGCALR